MKLEDLYLIIKNRQDNPKAGSYVSSLFEKGIDRIAQKVGEEATEVVIASKNNDKQRLIEEMADLWFHSLIMLSAKELKPKDIFKELEKRHREKKRSLS